MNRHLLLPGAAALALAFAHPVAAADAAPTAPAAPAASPAAAPAPAAPAPVVPGSVGDPGKPYRFFVVPAGLKPAQVQSALATAFANRRWLIKERSEGKVVGYLNHRHHEAQVTFIYDAKEVKMSFWAYRLDINDNRMDPDSAAGWLRNLEGEVNQALNVAQISPP